MLLKLCPNLSSSRSFSRGHGSKAVLYRTQQTTAQRDPIHIMHKEIDALVKYSNGKLAQQQPVVLERVNYQHTQ